MYLHYLNVQMIKEKALGRIQVLERTPSMDSILTSDDDDAKKPKALKKRAPSMDSMLSSNAASASGAKKKKVDDSQYQSIVANMDMKAEEVKKEREELKEQREMQREQKREQRETQREKRKLEKTCDYEVDRSVQLRHEVPP
jgi:organic radical activating enzyme